MDNKKIILITLIAIITFLGFFAYYRNTFVLSQKETVNKEVLSATKVKEATPEATPTTQPDKETPSPKPKVKYTPIPEPTLKPTPTPEPVSAISNRLPEQPQKHTSVIVLPVVQQPLVIPPQIIDAPPPIQVDCNPINNAIANTKNTYQEMINNQIKITNNLMVARGLSTQDPAVQQEVENATAPLRSQMAIALSDICLRSGGCPCP